MIGSCLNRSGNSTSQPENASLDGVVAAEDDDPRTDHEEDPCTDLGDPRAVDPPVDAVDVPKVETAFDLGDADDTDWMEALDAQDHKQQEMFTMGKLESDGKGNFKGNITTKDGSVRGTVSTWTDKAMVTVYCWHLPCLVSMAFHNCPDNDAILAWFERGEALGKGKEHMKAHKDTFFDKPR